MKLFKNITIKRNNDFYLDNSSYQVLTMLYKPLIQSESLNIYLSIYQLSLTLSDVTSLFLTDIIQSNIKQETLIEKLDILKEYKLIKYNEQELTIFKPLNKEDYLKYNLTSILKNLTSKVEFEYILNNVYGNTFEVSDIDSLKVISKLKYNESKRNTVPYSFIELKKHLDNITNIDSLKDTFDSISTLYNYSLEDILKIVYEVENEGSIDKDKLINESYNRYKSKQDLKKNIKNTDSDIDCLKYFKEYNPETALAYGGRRVSEADKKTIERLKKETSLSDELISLLVIYSLVTNNYKMHAYRFYEVIYNDWKNKRIETLEEAYHYINTLYMDNNNSKKSQNKTSEDWFNDMWAKIKEEQNDR